MKRTTTVGIVVGVGAALMLGVSSATSRPPEEKAGRPNVRWVEKCLQDFESIKPGMTRGEIENRFPLDGGLQGVSPVRFLHPACPYFKIDVVFAFKRNPDDQNRAVSGKEDKATRASKPYIERPFAD
jgi:hypothetical protein